MRKIKTDFEYKDALWRLWELMGLDSDEKEAVKEMNSLTKRIEVYKKEYCPTFSVNFRRIK